MYCNYRVCNIIMRHQILIIDHYTHYCFKHTVANVFVIEPYYRHTDGSVRFWDASAGSLQVLYKLKTAKVFEKTRSKSPEGTDEDQFSVQLLSFCPESRKLAVAGISSYVVLFKFRKLESTFETTVI